MNATLALENKTAAELILVWNQSETQIDALKTKPRTEELFVEWDALITVRGWIMKAMQLKMTDAEFCKVVGIPND
jgi:hypothetical protein